MNRIDSLSQNARKAFNQKNWPEAERNAKAITALDKSQGEGFFLLGLIANAKRNPNAAIVAFEKSFAKNDQRYDAAISGYNGVFHFTEKSSSKRENQFIGIYR